MQTACFGQECISVPGSTIAAKPDTEAEAGIGAGHVRGDDGQLCPTGVSVQGMLSSAHPIADSIQIGTACGSAGGLVIG